MQMRQTMGVIASVSALPDEQRAALTDFTDGGREELMNTYINMTWSEVLQVLEAYSRSMSCCDDFASNAYKEKDGYRVTLLMPVTFHEPALQGLIQNVQEYMVASALGRYLLLVNREEALVFTGKAEEARKQIRRFLDSRVRPARVRPFPNW